jgi:hypothetical protein
MHLNVDINDQEIQLAHSADLGPETIIKMLAAVQNKLINDHFEADKDEIILEVVEILNFGDKPKGPKAYKPDDDFSVSGKF